MSEDVLFEKNGPTAIITLNRPEKLNAWTEAMRSELIDYLEGLKGNDEIRAVILTGSGRAFCAGQDLAEPQRMRPEDTNQLKPGSTASTPLPGRSQPGRGQWPRSTASRRLRLPVLHSSRTCEWAAPKSGWAGAKCSQDPQHYGIWAMWSILGKSKTSQFVLTGELVDAAEAQRLGLLTTSRTTALYWITRRGSPRG